MFIKFPRNKLFSWRNWISKEEAWEAFLTQEDRIWAKKSQSFPFSLNIGTQGISTMLILVPQLVFWILKPKSIFGQMCAKKIKFVHFGWKSAHLVSRGCWFLFRHSFTQFPTLNLFLGRVRSRKWKCLFRLK